MEIIIGKTAGFCFGVKNAVTKAEEELRESRKAYCLGELVHNNQVTQELVKNGMIFINSIEEAQGKAIIRAHGVPKEVYNIAKQRGTQLVDLTCPKVIHIHKIAEEYANMGYYIFLIGQKEHPEIKGTISFCGENSYIIEEMEEVEEAIKYFNEKNKEKALIIPQTTYSLEKFNEIAERLKTKLKIEKLEIKNTICNATKQRQEEVIEISKKVKTMIIIGSKTSSNSNKLYEISKKHCNNVIFIETKDELNLSKLDKKGPIGIMAGASTPQKSIDEVVEKIKEIC